jgi:hypothetical protein
MVVQKKQWPADIASTLDTTFGTKQGLEDQHVNAGCPLFVPAQTFSIPAIGHIVRDDVASTMTRHTGSGSGETQNVAFVVQPIDFRNLRFHDGDVAGTMQSKSSGGYSLNYETGVMQPIPINSMNAFRSPDADPTTGCGIGEAGEAMFTITKGNSHAVAQPIGIFQDSEYGVAKYDNAGTLRAGRIPEHQMVMQPITFSSVQSNQGINADLNVSQTLEAKNPMAVMQPVTYAETAQTLTAGYEFDYNDEKKAASHIVGMQVRRLTPVECERLQGFPDNYTNIPWRKKDESPDGPRYKALGNSWAVPNVRWIGKRIQEQINAP